MTDRGRAGSGRATWPRTVTALHELLDAIRGLESDYATTVGVLRGAVHRIETRGEALYVLGLLDVDYTVALVDDLVGLAVDHTYAGRIREILGRLPHRDAGHLVPPAVWHHLDEMPDDDAYRRFAELLDHLGLADALNDLVQRTRASDDPDIQEVAEDYGR